MLKQILSCGLCIFLLSCASMISDNTITCQGVVAESEGCQGITINPVTLIVHAPIDINDNVFDENKIREHIAYAQSLFINSNIIFEKVIIVHDMPPYNVIYNSQFENISIFHNLNSRSRNGIHIFIVNEIVDAKKYVKNKRIIGMQHSKHQRSCQNTIFITNDTNEQTFAHELGHYFGLRHINDTNNIMYHNSSQRSSIATFNKEQYIYMNTNAKFVVNYCIRNNEYIV